MIDFGDVYNLVFSGNRCQEMLTYFEEGEKKTLNRVQFGEKVDAMAARLEEQLDSVEKGRWIGWKLDTTVHSIALFFSALKIGYKVLLMDMNADRDSVQAFAEQSDMAAIMTESKEDYPDIINITMSDLKAVCEGAPKSVNWSNKIAFCTSGTTGRAKVFVFNANSVFQESIAVGERVLMTKDMDEVRDSRDPQDYPFLLSLPFRHCLGFGIVIAYLGAGYPLIFPEKPGIFGLVDTCKNHGVWAICSVPAIWKAILKIAEARFGSCESEAIHKLLGDRVTFGVSAGAKLESSYAQKLLKTGIIMANGWGLTETSFCTVGLIRDDESTDYVGRMYNRQTAKIRSLDDGSVTDDGYGELLVNGPTLHCARLVEGKEIERDPDEFFATGDILEKKGTKIYFKGRIKGVIVADNGENIYPEELDTRFALIEDMVKQYCTVGIDEKPVLFVSSDDAEGFEDTKANRIIQEMNRSLPVAKRITRIFCTKLNLPVTSKGEVGRFHLFKYFEKNRDSFRILKP